MNTVGSHKRVQWALLPLNQVFHHMDAAKWYFPLSPDGEPVGDHFKTKVEMLEWIDAKEQVWLRTMWLADHPGLETA